MGPAPLPQSCAGTSFVTASITQPHLHSMSLSRAEFMLPGELRQLLMGSCCAQARGLSLGLGLAEQPLRRDERSCRRQEGARQWDLMKPRPRMQGEPAGPVQHRQQQPVQAVAPGTAMLV